MTHANLAFSILILIAAAAVMLYALLSFVHVRISDADMAELDRLRAEGILPSRARLEDDYEVIQQRLAEIAPAVYMREDLWIALYFQIMRLARWVERRETAAASPRLESEMRRLCSHQARQYRIAMERMEAFQNPGL